MKRFLISIIVVVALYELAYIVISKFTFIHIDSYVYGVWTGFAVLWIMQWISEKFNKAEELEELKKQVETEIKEKREKEKNETSKINYTDVS